MKLKIIFESCLTVGCLFLTINRDVFTVKAQDFIPPEPPKSIDQTYEMCKDKTGKRNDKTCADGVSECCEFNQVAGELKGKFCVTEKQKNGQPFGTFTDNEGDVWSWTCAFEID